MSVATKNRYCQERHGITNNKGYHRVLNYLLQIEISIVIERTSSCKHLLSILQLNYVLNKMVLISPPLDYLIVYLHLPSYQFWNEFHNAIIKKSLLLDLTEGIFRRRMLLLLKRLVLVVKML